MVIPPTSQASAAPDGVLKGAGGVLAAAVAGTDFVSPTGSGSQLTGILAGQIGSVPAGVLKGVSGAFAAAVVGTDFVNPAGLAAYALDASVVHATGGLAEDITGIKTARARLRYRVPSIGTNITFQIADSTDADVWNWSYVDSDGSARLSSLGNFGFCILGTGQVSFGLAPGFGPADAKLEAKAGSVGQNILGLYSSAQVTQFIVKGDGKIGTNQTSAGSTPGTVVAKLPIYDTDGIIVGYAPLYSAIT